MKKNGNFAIGMSYRGFPKTRPRSSIDEVLKKES